MTEQMVNNQELVETLRRANPVLNPLELSKVFPSYNSFIPHRKEYGLWSILETLPRVMTSYMQQDNVVLAISGIAASGKDAIRETVQKINPGLLHKAVTATSRKPREGEIEGKDYYFYKNARDFEEAIAKGDFVEWVKQGERYYGLPKKSLSDSLNRNEPVVVTHVEMASGWPAIDEVAKDGFGDKKVFPLKVFVLLNMTFNQYAEEWLPERREDVNARLERAAWEISVAAQKADFIVTNTIGKDLTALEWQSQVISNKCVMLLKSERSAGFQTFRRPYEISPGISGREQIVKFHDRLIEK